MMNRAIRRALAYANRKRGQPQTPQAAAPVPVRPVQHPIPRQKDMPVDPTRSKSSQERKKFQDGGSSIMFQKDEPERIPLPLRPYEQRFNPKSGKLDAAERKDIGFYGPIKNPMTDHEITEYSSDRDFQYPTVYEGMSDKDRAAIMMAERLGKNAPKGALADVDDRAYAQAKKRKAQGRSPFYEPGKDPYPKWSPEQHWDEPYGMPKDESLYYADGGIIEEPPKKEYAPFNVLPFREDETGIHFDKNAGLLGPITRGLKIARQAAPTWMGGEGHYDPNNPEDFKATQDLAGLAFGSGTAFNKAPRGAIGSFAGPRAEGVNLDTYREAQKAFREANFMDPQTERSMAARYGWHPYGRDPKTGDLRLFTELSDAPAKFDLAGGTSKFIEREREKVARNFDPTFSGVNKLIDNAVAENILKNGVKGPLKEFYSNPYVFSAYPHFENMQLNVVPKNKVSKSGKAQAAYKFRRDNAIDPYINIAKSVAKNPQEAKLAVAHELQHGGQHFEDTIGPITNWEDHPDYPNIPNPAYQLYQEALVSDPTMQKLKTITTSPDFVRAVQVWNDQFKKRQSELLRTVNGVTDFGANKSALIDKLHHEISAAFPAFAEAFNLTKELEAKGIPSAAPSKYIGKDEAYILSQHEAQARNTEYRHDWDDLKRQMNYPKDTMPLDSNSTGRLGFIPFNRLHNFAHGGTVDGHNPMSKDNLNKALDVALSATHPKRLHHTLARTGYAEGGIPDIQGPAELAGETPYTHGKTLASQFDVAKVQPYKAAKIAPGPVDVKLPKKSMVRAPRADIGKMRMRKPKMKKFKGLQFAKGGAAIEDALNLASRTMSNMAKHIGDEGVHGASMQQGATSTIVKEKLPGKKSEVVYEHHAKTPVEREEFAKGGLPQETDYDMSQWDDARKKKAIENRFATSPKTGASEATPKSEPSDVTPKISPEEYNKGKLGEGRFALAGGGTAAVSYQPKAQDSTNNFVITAYEEMLGRKPSKPELTAWVNYLDQGGTDKGGLMSTLAQSVEGANWANTKAVDQTFWNMAGRQATQADYNTYLPQLAAGTLDYTGLRNAISKDPDAQNYQNTQLLNDTAYALLGRPATQKEQNDYLPRLADGSLDSDKLFNEISQRPDSLAYQKDEKAIAPKVSIAPPDSSSFGYDQFKTYLGDSLKAAGDDLYSKLDAINKALQMPLSAGEQAGLDLISRLESGGNYNMILGDNITKDPASGRIAKSIGYTGNLDQMPLNELYKMQGDMLRSPANNKNSSAVGKLQFTRENLFGTEKAGFKDGQLYKFGITPDMWNRFSLTPALQDKLGAQMAIEKRGMDLTNPNTWGQNAKNEWASMWDTLRNKEGINAVKAAAEGPAPTVGGKSITVPGGGTTPVGGGATTPDIGKPIGPGSSLSIDKIYNQSYGRNASDAEKAYLNNRIAEGSLNLDMLAAYIPTTAEAQQYANTAIDNIYNQSYGRAATDAEKNYINKAINSGTLTRENLAAYLPTTEEGKKYATEAPYRQAYKQAYDQWLAAYSSWKERTEVAKLQQFMATGGKDSSLPSWWPQAPTPPNQAAFIPTQVINPQPNIGQQLAGSGAGGNVGSGAAGTIGGGATSPTYTGTTPTYSGGTAPTGYTYNPVSNAAISNQINQNMMANANANAIQGSSGSGSTVGGGTIGAGSGSSSAGASSGNFAVNYMNRGGKAAATRKALRIANHYANGGRAYLAEGGRWVGKEWIDEDGITHKRETPPQDAGITTPRSKASKTTPKVLIPPEEYRKGNIGPGAYALYKGGRANLATGGDPTKLATATSQTSALPTTTVAGSAPSLQSQIADSYRQYFGSPNQDHVNYIADQVQQGKYTLPQTQQWMQSQAGQDWYKQLSATPQTAAVQPATTATVQPATTAAAAPSFAAPAAQPQVSDLMSKYFGSSNPDVANYINQQVQKGAYTLPQIESWMQTPEAKSWYASSYGAQPSTSQQPAISQPSSAAADVAASYEDAFGQQLSQEQLDIVMKDINQGKYTPDQLRSAWVNSVPSQQYYIQNYWKDLTGKDLTAEQSKTLADALNNKTYSEDAIISAMEASPDAISYNNDQLIEDTFAGYGLEPTPEQKAQFLNDLNSGKKTLDQVDTEIGNLPGAGMGETILPYDVAGKGVAKAGIPNTPARIEKYLASVPAEVVEAGKKLLIKEMDEQGITYPPQARDVIGANVIGETGFGLAPEKSYQGTSNSRIRKLFSGARKLTDKELNELKKDDRSFFNKVYGDVNGNEGGDDGYNYRGRGAVQLTGKANYLKYGELAGLGDALVKNPDLVNDPNIGTKVAVAFMKDKLKHGKGRNAFDRITKGVNSHGPTVSKKRTIYKSLVKDSPFSIKLMPETGPTTPGGEKPPTTPEFKPPGPSSDAGTGAAGTGVGGGSGSIASGSGSIGGGSGSVGGGGVGGGTGGGGGGTASGSADASSTGNTGVYLGPMVVNGQTAVGAQPGYTADAAGVYHNYADNSWTSSEYKNPYGAGWIDSIDNVKRGGRVTGNKEALRIADHYANGGGAWTRKEGKNPKGGLNAKGRASLRAQGHDIRPPAPHPKTDKDAARRKSFCARMSGMPGPMKDDNGKPTRKALSLRAWNCRADGGMIDDALRLARSKVKE